MPSPLDTLLTPHKSQHDWRLLSINGIHTIFYCTKDPTHMLHMDMPTEGIIAKLTYTEPGDSPIQLIPLQ